MSGGTKKDRMEEEEEEVERILPNVFCVEEICANCVHSLYDAINETTSCTPRRLLSYNKLLPQDGDRFQPIVHRQKRYVKLCIINLLQVVRGYS